jgi:hypothetical protein
VSVDGRNDRNGQCLEKQDGCYNIPWRDFQLVKSRGDGTSGKAGIQWHFSMPFFVMCMISMDEHDCDRHNYRSKLKDLV